jgi:glycosyltransferase involved in cell wall biosynthesis
MQIYADRKPAISVIIPTFNRAGYIEKCIDSVIQQTFEDWEIIIIDDGSIDNTYQVVKRFLNEHENIRYTFHKNRGVTLSMNAGMKICSGKYITFLGSDDQYKTDHLELRYNYLKDNPEVDLIHGSAEIIGNRFVKDKNDLSKTIDLEECILGGTLFGKSNVFFELNGFRKLAYSGESDFVERAEKQFKIEKVHFKTYIYFRDTPGSITNSV